MTTKVEKRADELVHQWEEEAKQELRGRALEAARQEEERQRAEAELQQLLVEREQMLAAVEDHRQQCEAIYAELIAARDRLLTLAGSAPDPSGLNMRLHAVMQRLHRSQERNRHDLKPPRIGGIYGLDGLKALPRQLGGK